MASTCSSCGTSLSFFQKLTGKALCSSCATEQKQTRQAAEQEYNTALSELISSPAPVSEIQSRLPVLAQEAALSEGERRNLHLKSFRSYLVQALEDDYLTEAEEARMNEIAETLGIDQASFDKEFDDLKAEMVVARANDGRLPTLPDPHVLLKKGETAHIETNAALLKEVAVREWQGGYRGVSFRVAKGVRFHTGGARGRSVVVGTKVQADDTGILTVTSHRAVFAGQWHTIDMPYSKLVNLNVFADGVQFHMSNRKNPPMFQVSKGLGHAVAAVVNAASQEYVS